MLCHTVINTELFWEIWSSENLSSLTNIGKTDTDTNRCHWIKSVLILIMFVYSSCRTHISLLSLNDCIILYGNQEDDSLTDRHGCPAYVSPELLINGKGSYSGRAADIWSLGVSLYTMLIGRYPFQDTQPAALFAKIRHGSFTLPERLSPQAKCLIGCMLRKSPVERLNASELLMHPWLTSPSVSHYSMQKTQHSSQQTLQIKQEENQVVPTWTEKAQ